MTRVETAVWILRLNSMMTRLASVENELADLREEFRKVTLTDEDKETITLKFGEN